MRELSVTEQRYKAVLAVIAEGRTVTQVAREWNVARQTIHVWLERYEADGLEGLANRSHRPAHCPHQMSAVVEAQLGALRQGYFDGCVIRLERRDSKDCDPVRKKPVVFRGRKPRTPP